MAQLWATHRHPIRRLVGLAAAALAGLCLLACDSELPEENQMNPAPIEQGNGNGLMFCSEAATNVPVIAEWTPIVDIVPGEPLPDSLLEALSHVKLTRRWLDLPDLPLLLSDFEVMTVGAYVELLMHDSLEPDDAYDLILRSTDGISDVPGSRNAVVYVWHLWPEDEPESWYIYDWRYELPCPPEES